MASSLQRSTSTRMPTPLPVKPGKILIAFDATKNRNNEDLKNIIVNVLARDEMIQGVDTIKVLGVLHKVLHPMGFWIQIGPDSFVGAHGRAIKEEVARKVDECVGMLQHSAEQCEGEGVDIEVKIAVGAPINKVVVQEIMDVNATWAILDRQLRKELSFYREHIPCKVAHVRDDLTLHVLRFYNTDKSTECMKHKLLFSLSKPVSPQPVQDNESDRQSVITQSASSTTSSDIPNNSVMMPSTAQHEEDDISLRDEPESKPRPEISGCQDEPENKRDASPEVLKKEKSPQNRAELPALSTASSTKPEQDLETLIDDIAVERRTGSDPLRFSYSDIQAATQNFSSDNLLKEVKCGAVYKGQLKDGQLIAVRVQQNEIYKRDFMEFRSDISTRLTAMHTNIVTLLGYCLMENLFIFIYQYISHKSLEWHLFDKTVEVLEWDRRQAIAIGTAKALQFLHEKCRRCPIVHQDIRPRNILLTDDYVPMLGDFGLAKWKTKECEDERRVLGSLACVAPEYAETGICSVKTDVYAFGVVLIQLISGRKAVDSTRDDQPQSIRQWATPLIQTLALNELVDPRLGDLYSMYEVYNMARTAHLCIQSEPSMRPTMGEVLRLLEGANDHLRHVKSNLYPMILSTEASLY